jgi:hypothetical protein
MQIYKCVTTYINVQRNGDDADENSLKNSMHLAVPTTFNHKLSNHKPIQWYC